MRTIVAEMLLNMNDKVTLTNRDVKNMQHELATFNMKINETNNKMDREAKIKDLVDQLKIRINQLVSSFTFSLNRHISMMLTFPNIYPPSRRKEWQTTLRTL